MIKSELPFLKEEMIKRFGYISFQLVLANLDVVGIRKRKDYEVVIIIYRGGNKVGFFYEEGNLSEQKVYTIYQDVPMDKNDLEAYEKLHSEKMEVLLMPENNYVFINDKEVINVKQLNQK